MNVKKILGAQVKTLNQVAGLLQKPDNALQELQGIYEKSPYLQFN